MLKKGCPICVPKNPVCCPNAPHTGVHSDTFYDSLNCKYFQIYSRSIEIREPHMKILFIGTNRYTGYSKLPIHNRNMQ